MTVAKMLETGRQTPMVPVTAIVTFPATALVQNGNATWFSEVTPIIPNAFGANLATNIPHSTHPEVPVKDSTAGEEGITLQAGVYMARIVLQAGDAAAVGAVGDAQFAFGRKDFAIASDRNWTSINLPTASENSAAVGTRLASEITFQTEICIENATDGQVYQLVGRMTGAHATALKAGYIVIQKIGNYPEAV